MHYDLRSPFKHKEEIKPGAQVLAGTVIGQSGNTGMRESTLGSKSGSHLHWELILQKGKRRNLP